jgi:hypothetical protein
LEFPKERSRNVPNHISIWENGCQPFDLTEMRSDPLLCKRGKKEKKKKKKKKEKQESELASPGPIQIWPGPRFQDLDLVSSRGTVCCTY